MKKIFTLFLLSCISVCLNATLILPPDNLGEMAINAELVIYAEASSHADENGYINNFTVLDVINGDAYIGKNVQVAEYSGIDDLGRQYVISGDVDFKIGTKYLLFLGMTGGGYYKLQYLSLSSFEEGVPDGKSKVFAHDQSLLDLYLFDQSMKETHGLSGAYYSESLISHLKEVVKENVNWNIGNAGLYFLNEQEFEGTNTNNEITKSQGPCPNEQACHCTTLFDGVTPNPAKYVNNTWTVCVAGGASDDPSSSTEIADLGTAISNMNAMPGINISYTGIDATATPLMCPLNGQGNPSASGDATSFPNSSCNKMFVFFDDPCNEIADVDGGCFGTLGIGGHFVTGATHVDDCGVTWNTACFPFFVMNNFGVCAPNTVAQNDYIAVLTHEMLHAIGIGHHHGGTAFTTTAVGDNACSAAGAFNPASAATGAINHNGSECTGLMNPVICNSPAPSAANNYSITALDQTCTDWMYNITSNSTCAISNISVANAACAGTDVSFDVSFDYVDADDNADLASSFSIEVNGASTTVNTTTLNSGNADDGNVTLNVTQTNAAGGSVTITVRNDEVFACTADELNVTLP